MTDAYAVNKRRISRLRTTPREVVPDSVVVSVRQKGSLFLDSSTDREERRDRKGA